MTRSARITLVSAVLVVLVALDQATKWLAIVYLRGRFGPVWSFPSSWYPNDLFHLVYAENTGAFLSLGSTLTDGLRFWLLTGLNIVILTVVAGILVLRQRLDFSRVLPLTLILSGGLGNLIDRLARDGRVVDFMNMGIGGLRTGVFNVADVAIMAGLFALLFAEFFLPAHPLGTSEQAPAGKE
jgi:signal peptidase II